MDYGVAGAVGRLILPPLPGAGAGYLDTLITVNTRSLNICQRSATVLSY